MRPYEMLSRHYSRDWGHWGVQYVRLIPWIEGRCACRISSVVDLACGIGTLLNELHKHDYKVTGIDQSPEMIRLARELNPEVEYIVEDIATARIGMKADLAICSFDSLNYLTDENHLRKTLGNVSRMLRPGGYFAFDINTPFLYEEKQQGIIERVSQGVKFSQIFAYDKDQRLSTVTFDFGEGKREVHVQRAYTIDGMKGYLLEAGFSILGIYENFDMREATDTTASPFSSLKAEWSPRTEALDRRARFRPSTGSRALDGLVHGSPLVTLDSILLLMADTLVFGAHPDDAEHPSVRR